MANQLLNPVENEMFRFCVLLASKPAAAGFACLMLLAPASSFAQSRYAWPEERRAYRTPVEVWLSGEGWDEDFSSSHVCVNGYRWITRDLDSNGSAAQRAYPVRC